MAHRLAVDLTDAEYQVFLDAQTITGHRHHTSFVRFMVLRIKRDIQVELEGGRVCHKLKNGDTELVAPLTSELGDGSEG